ncbi:hypothetical protein ACIHCX_10830 [Streptomyces sp. NPDC052043]|uniref:hypothetical protein n=1 Tax=Streptomyces sp. NPDC052043 TaxID=3365684 RepID=UPI0037CEAF00
MSAFDHDDLADLDEDDVETLGELTDAELAAALDALYERERNPLDGYARPVTRLQKPRAAGRGMRDLPPL